MNHMAKEITGQKKSHGKGNHMEKKIPSVSPTQRTWTSTASAGGNLALRQRLSAGVRATAPNTTVSQRGTGAPSALGRATDRTSSSQQMPSTCYCNVTLYFVINSSAKTFAVL